MTLSLTGASARALALGVYALAAWRGDAPVRAACAWMALATLAMPAIQDHVSWSDPGHRLALLDLGLFLGLVALTLYRPRYWLVVASAFQLLSFTADLVVAGTPVAAPRAWLHVTVGFTWGVTACILVGALLVPQRGARPPQHPPDRVVQRRADASRRPKTKD